LRIWTATALRAGMRPILRDKIGGARQ
jgi:hypothetical protein